MSTVSNSNLKANLRKETEDSFCDAVHIFCLKIPHHVLKILHQNTLTD